MMASFSPQTLNSPENVRNFKFIKEQFTMYVTVKEFLGTENNIWQIESIYDLWQVLKSVNVI